MRPNDKLTDIRRQWKKLIIENHPDRVLAKGLPKEAIKLANARILRINNAWEKIKLTHQ
jgi:DnaJ like chaperone protein